MLETTLKSITHQDKKLILRQACDTDVPALRKLINESYKELSDKGWNYTATFQDEEKTRERIQKGKAFVLVEHKIIIATILYYADNHYTGNNTAYIGQFAVQPEFKKQGLGSLLMDYCESLAVTEKYHGIQLDTASPATHLVNWCEVSHSGK